MLTGARAAGADYISANIIRTSPSHILLWKHSSDTYTSRRTSPVSPSTTVSILKPFNIMPTTFSKFSLAVTSVYFLLNSLLNVSVIICKPLSYLARLLVFAVLKPFSMCRSVPSPYTHIIIEKDIFVK